MVHDRSGSSAKAETTIPGRLPVPCRPLGYLQKYKGISAPSRKHNSHHAYHFDGSGRAPHYYQQIAINRTVEAIAKGQNRVLIVMATGTGKTYTAFQIIHRLWKSGTKADPVPGRPQRPYRPDQTQGLQTL